MTKEKGRKVIKILKMNCIERQLVISTMLQVFKDGASGTSTFWMSKVDEALDLVELLEWEQDKADLINKRVKEWNDGPKDGPAPVISDEEDFGKESEYKLIKPVFSFIQNFLTKYSKYQANMRKHIVKVHEKFAIRYEDDDNGEVEIAEERVNEDDIKVIKKKDEKTR